MKREKSFDFDDWKTFQKKKGLSFFQSRFLLKAVKTIFILNQQGRLSRRAAFEGRLTQVLQQFESSCFDGGADPLPLPPYPPPFSTSFIIHCLFADHIFAVMPSRSAFPFPSLLIVCLGGAWLIRVGGWVGRGGYAAFLSPSSSSISFPTKQTHPFSPNSSLPINNRVGCL